jgi:hypothetical protein
MTSHQPTTNESVFKRILWLYGLFTLIANAAYLFGYNLLPEGFLRDSPTTTGARLAATGTFWSEFALTLLNNLGLLLVFGVLPNLIQIKGFSVGYLWLLGQGVITHLVSGTNSFVASDLKQFNAWDGMAFELGIGGLEFLAYTLVIASTVSLGIYQFQSWWQWKPAKAMNFRDVRLSRAELLCLIGGILLLILAAYRETAMRVSL